MNEEIDSAIKSLVLAVSKDISADALRFTQAALNLAHVKSILAEEKK